MTKLTFKDWPKLKTKIEFEYNTLPYDPDKKALKKALKHNQNIEEIILDRSEGMWRCLFEVGFGMTYFPINGVDITARVWEGSFVCRLDLMSKKYISECSIIHDKYFSSTKSKNYQIKELLKNQKSKNGKLRIVNPNFKVEGIIDAIGKGLDPKIKELVKIFNQLGINTVSSCEGHEDHGLPYPWIDINMLSLPTFLGLIHQLNETELLDFIVSPSKFDFRFQPPAEYSLNEGQQSFQKLVELTGLSLTWLNDRQGQWDF